MKAQVSTLPRVSEIKERWYIVDAEGQVLGRVAARIAKLVKGKLNPDYTPHLDPKIHVVVVNADKVVLTGKKMTDKKYFHHTGWRTGIKTTTPEKVFAEKPTDVLRKAVHGMLPKNRLGVQLNKHVKIYAGTDHPHAAQAPETLVVKTRQPKKKL